MLKNRKKGYVAGLAVLLGSSLIMTACGKEDVKVEEVSAVVVDVQKAETGNLTLQNSFVGTISSQETVYVIPFASGTVTETYFEVGDEVNAGDVLFRIDDAGAKLQLEQAQLSAASARQQADMATGSQQKSADLQLDSSGIQVQSQYEQAQIAYYQAGKAYDEIENEVETTKEYIEKLEAVIEAGVIPGGTTGGSVSSSDAEQTTPEDKLKTAKEGLAKLETQRDLLHNQFLQAQSAYRATEAGKENFEATKNLTQGEIRQDTKSQLNTSLQLAQLGVDSAELALSYYTVTAPISGVVQSKGVEVNGIAASSNPAYTIANENSMTVTFQVSEAVKNTLQVGDGITVLRGEESYPGHITEVGVAVNMQTGLFQVKANVEADGSKLPSGVSVKITADTYQAENAVLIPYDAVYYDNEGAYVYLNQNGVAAKTYVTTGLFDDTIIEITDGIAAGDIVVTSWSPRLLDGAEITATAVAE